MELSRCQVASQMSGARIAEAKTEHTFKQNVWYEEQRQCDVVLYASHA